MAKQMTDEQKLFFGTKAQRAAVKRKHPSWAKDKSGFRQTIKGHRNPFKTKAKTRKPATRKPATRKPATTRSRAGGGGSSSWLEKLAGLESTNALLKREYEALVSTLNKTGVPSPTGTAKGIIESLTKGVGIGAGAGLVIPGTVLSPQPEPISYDEIKQSNLEWIEQHPGADPYGLLDPQYAIA